MSIGMVNPHWLLSFTTLVAQGSFTRAAGSLGLTQAAVSQHIKYLEQAFGALLIRRARSIELTPAGMALLDYCAEVSEADQRLQLKVSDTAPDKGVISLITPASVGLSLYPLLLDLQRQHRGLIIRHQFASDSGVIGAVVRNQYEVGLVTVEPNDSRLEAELFSAEPLELVVPAGNEVNTWSDLERLGYIDHPDGVAMATRLFTHYFPGNPGVHNLPQRGFTSEMALVLEPVARGLGFTVLPRHARRAFTLNDAIHVIERDTPVADNLWLIRRAEWPLTSRASWVLDQVRQRLPGIATREPVCLSHDHPSRHSFAPDERRCA